MKRHSFIACLLLLGASVGLLIQSEKEAVPSTNTTDSALTQSDSVLVQNDSALAQNDSTLTEPPVKKKRVSRRAAQARKANAQDPRYLPPAMPGVTGPCKTGSG